MAGKQIDFPELQKHSKGFEQALWIACAISIVLVLLAIFIVS